MSANDTSRGRWVTGLEGLRFGHAACVFSSPPPLRMQLAPGLNSPRSARAAVRRLLGEGVPDEVARDAQLLTSEIVANAMAVGGGCELSAWCLPGGAALRVEVFDTSPRIPEMRKQRRPFEIGGRGLQLVNAIATRWGVESRPGGKSVWFEISRTC